MKLFCFPFAGGSATYYYDWKKELAPDFEVIPIELKGRGSRFNEDFDRNFQDMLTDVYTQLISYKLDDFMLFGHSMGGLLAFEILCQLALEKKQLPKRIFLSGCKPPHLFDVSGIVPDKNLPNDRYIEEVAKLGGTSRDVLENDELIDLMVPIIKNDFSNLLSYHFSKKVNLDIPISILAGTEDTISKKQIFEWNNYSNSFIDFHFSPGDHFFITTDINAILDYINTFK